MMRVANQYDPHMKEAIHRIRGTYYIPGYSTPHAYNSPASGRYKLIALTNSFSTVDVPFEERRFLGWDDGVTPTHLRELFDDFCDSSSLGMRFVAIPSANLILRKAFA